jgi:hypothetical protein
MSFLRENSPFPPVDWAFYYDKMEEWATWYSGEADYLVKYYTTKAYSEFENNVFWARMQYEERITAIHNPLAGSIAEMGAKLLFSESPRIQFNKTSLSGKRFDECLKGINLNSLLLESAELAGAMSGIFLKIDIDTNLSNQPLLSSVCPQQAFPIFYRGELYQLLTFRECLRIEKNGMTTVYRLFEHRKIVNKNCVIEYKLMKGKPDNVGKEVENSEIEETAEMDLSPITITNLQGLGAVYIPNLKPNKLLPGSDIGINDFNSSIPLLDSYDEAWSSWIRDIELGMGKIFVDEELLNKSKDSYTGESKSYLEKFNNFSSCFIKLNMDSYKFDGGSSANPINPVQFAMRTDEHSKNCNSLSSEIIQRCGYSPQTFGLDNEGRAESGTALRIRERASFLTREAKSRYWITGLNKLFKQYQIIDKSIFNKTSDIENISIELEDSIISDAKEISEILQNLNNATAISTYLKVKMQHPDWEEKEILNEVDNINKDNGIITEDIFNNNSNNGTEEEKEEEENIKIAK